METHKPSVGGGSGGGRDDCWSDGATAVLIEAWGERHRRCNQGFLRHHEWKEVSDAVNDRDSAAGKPRRTDVQCKNRIDTLKKKYKVEKAKSKSSPSTWPFFHRLDFLICNRSLKNPNPNPNPNTNPKLRFNSAESSEVSLDDEMLLGVVGRTRKHKHRLESGSRLLVVEEEEEWVAFSELAKAVSKFGEIYERIESSKQHQLMELERQRMEFTKELELQRMNMLINAQLKLEKLKRPRNAATATGKNS